MKEIKLFTKRSSAQQVRRRLKTLKALPDLKKRRREFIDEISVAPDSSIKLHYYFKRLANQVSSPKTDMASHYMLFENCISTEPCRVNPIVEADYIFKCVQVIPGKEENQVRIEYAYDLFYLLFECPSSKQTRHKKRKDEDDEF